MNQYICLMRGINVSGQKKIQMKELKKLFESLGYENITTYIQSGNILFETPLKNKENISKAIEAAISSTYNFEVPCLIITPEKLAYTIKNNPLLSSIKDAELKKIYISFLFHTPNEESLIKLFAFTPPQEKAIVQDDIVYLYYGNGAGRAKLNNNTIEKKLKTTATTRNWNTCNKLLELSKINH